MCLTTPTENKCCQCVQWQPNGLCHPHAWVNIGTGRDCSFEVSKYVKTNTLAQSLQPYPCQPGVRCEDSKCREINELRMCCRCVAWNPDGTCRDNSWLPDDDRIDCDFDPTPDELFMMVGDHVPSRNPTGCPFGVECEATRCRKMNGVETCCGCRSWAVDGQCLPDGWVVVGGDGDCDFATAMSAVEHPQEVPQTQTLTSSDEQLVQKLSEETAQSELVGNASEALQDASEGTELNTTGTDVLSSETPEQVQAVDGEVTLQAANVTEDQQEDVQVETGDTVAPSNQTVAVDDLVNPITETDSPEEITAGSAEQAAPNELNNTDDFDVVDGGNLVPNNVSTAVTAEDGSIETNKAPENSTAGESVSGGDQGDNGFIRADSSEPEQATQQIGDIGQHACPVRTVCEDTKCRVVNGVETCCQCIMWRKDGTCLPDGWSLSHGPGDCRFEVSS